MNRQKELKRTNSGQQIFCSTVHTLVLSAWDTILHLSQYLIVCIVKRKEVTEAIHTLIVCLKPIKFNINCFHNVNSQGGNIKGSSKINGYLLEHFWNNPIHQILSHYNIRTLINVLWLWISH